MLAFWIALAGCGTAAVVNLTLAVMHRTVACRLYAGTLALLYFPGYVAVLAGWCSPAEWLMFYIWLQPGCWMVWILLALTGQGGRCGDR